MNDYIKEALGLVKAQAAVRAMSDDEMVASVASIAKKLQALEDGAAVVQEQPAAVAEMEEVAEPVMDPKKSIRDRSITCLVCGKTFKIMTKKHLAAHGLDADSYCEKFGLKKGTALACKSLVKQRREKMQSMKLWEKRAAARETEGKK